MKYYEIGTKVENATNKSDVLFCNIDNPVFRVLGVWRGKDGIYRRVPEEVAESVSEAVKKLSSDAAGGRIRFTTNSPYVAIKAICNDDGQDSHTNLTFRLGMDVYEKEHYVGIFKPDPNNTNKLEGILELDGKTHDLTINMPNYTRIHNIEIGLAKDSEISSAPLYKYEKPVVFYGSSITQGACAGRTGMSYENILSRKLDCNYVNLGFSGNCKAESAMADYISSLDMSVFVYDYEHNAPSLDHLRDTHERLFLKVREKQPDLPIIIVSAPRYYYESVRSGVVKTTYLNALARGDKNVYFIPGYSFFENTAESEYPVDTTHPTDLGFYFMAKRIGPTLKKCLEDSAR